MRKLLASFPTIFFLLSLSSFFFFFFFFFFFLSFFHWRFCYLLGLSSLHLVEWTKEAFGCFPRYSTLKLSVQ